MKYNKKDLEKLNYKKEYLDELIQIQDLYYGNFDLFLSCISEQTQKERLVEFVIFLNLTRKYPFLGTYNYSLIFNCISKNISFREVINYTKLEVDKIRGFKSKDEDKIRNYYKTIIDITLNIIRMLAKLYDGTNIGYIKKNSLTINIFKAYGVLLERYDLKVIDILNDVYFKTDIRIINKCIKENVDIVNIYKNYPKWLYHLVTSNIDKGFNIAPYINENTKPKEAYLALHLIKNDIIGEEAKEFMKNHLLYNYMKTTRYDRYIKLYKEGEKIEDLYKNGGKKVSIIPDTWHPSWDELMTEENIKLLKEIESKIGMDFVPEKKNVLRFLQRDLSEIKCVWLGQDPYYTMYDENKYVANGAAFWPNDLRSWNQPFSQKSLQNIIRLIYKNYNNITEYKDIKSYSEIKKEIDAGIFNILPPQEWFKSLEEQGVLLLNIYLTTKKGAGNKHQKIWAPFSEILLKYISKSNESIRWFLWGNESQSKEQFIEKGIIYKSNHPTFCSIKYENDFLKNECFNETKDLINWLGISKS